MSENSKIEWTHHTFNHVWGCAKVSPGCDNCYAERDSGRFTPGKTLWGVDAARREFGDKHWNEPRKWNAKAEKEGTRSRVFCASMADVFDKNAPDGVRERLWKLIEETPNLDWLLLTKRVGNVARMIPDRWSASLPSNVWLGISVVNQDEANRDIPKLLAVKAHVRWLSMEPLLGPVSFEGIFANPGNPDDGTNALEALDWVVVGGESGHNARPMHPDWARSLRDQCEAVGTPFLFKQWGEWTPGENVQRGHGTVDIAYWFVDEWRFGRENLASFGCHVDDQPDLYRVGKKEAGRLLDGVQHDGYPVTGAAPSTPSQKVE